MSALYGFLLSIPERVFPFGGPAAYRALLAKDFARNGRGHYGAGLTLYREAFHLAGSIVFIGTAFTLARILGSRLVFLALSALLFAAITFQEAYLHPRFYDQPLYKGVLDWCAWMIPLALFLLSGAFASLED